MNEQTDRDDQGDDDILTFTLSDAALEAAAGAARRGERASQSFNPGALTVSFTCCSVA